ncbi:NAD(P)-dependent oxidoreductase [Pelagibacterium limicola]|uniref:NAD(P)-dependent oxidoreductase n=1 Tax=Pelagibacterium limicola TaxID=2791022 RepID=UPI0018AFDBA6|nr:NAD(P)-dependent oxidoreductase [Pelagibacterium limicola]
MTPSRDALAIGLLGFGEAASAFVSGWDRAPVASITAYDLKIEDAGSRDRLMALCGQHGVVAAKDHATAFGTADLVVSLVFADQAFLAASEASKVIAPGALFIDGNSCSPQTKARAARAINAAGGRYVDMAVMAPVHPKREKTPILLAGPDAEEVKTRLERLGMSPRIAGDTVGQASAIKLTRSIMIKGMEALFAEFILAARLGGVEEAVLASLEASDPDIDWRKRAAYSFDRMTVHGRRRAAEMRESASMVDELGLPNHMTLATVAWQQLLGDLPIQTGDVHEVLEAMGKGAPDTR